MDFGTIRAALVAAAALTLLSACAQVRPGPTNAPQMGVRSFLDIRHLCSLGISPPIEIDNAPPAARYRVRMVNTSVLLAPPADFEVVAEGSAIAEGALEGYRGPCPGETQSFDFRLEVAALDARGAVAAYGFTIVTANSTTRIMRLRQDLRPRMPPRAH